MIEKIKAIWQHIKLAFSDDEERIAKALQDMAGEFYRGDKE